MQENLYLKSIQFDQFSHIPCLSSPSLRLRAFASLRKKNEISATLTIQTELIQPFQFL